MFISSSMHVPLGKIIVTRNDCKLLKESIILISQIAGRGLAIQSSQAKLLKNPAVLDDVLLDLNGIPIISKSIH